MKAKKRQKLCYNCEGEIDLDVIVCPFCAADLREERVDLEETSSASHNIHEMSHSLYPPAYPLQEEREEVLDEGSSEKEVQESHFAEPILPIAGSIFLFASGATLFMLGCLMLFFSSGGELVLKWDARFWFLYLFVSLPLLIFGYRSISKL